MLNVDSSTTITKLMIAERLSEKIGFSGAEAKDLVDLYFTLFEESLIKNHCFSIKKLGVIKVDRKEERLGRNPKTKEEHIIKPRLSLQFAARLNPKTSMPGARRAPKSEIVYRIAQEMKSNNFIIANSVADEINNIFHELYIAGARMEIRNIGTFFVRTKKNRASRNPKTGESISVGERNYMAFKASSNLRARLEQSGAFGEF
jgi:integration host factor subunit alpha